MTTIIKLSNFFRLPDGTKLYYSIDRVTLTVSYMFSDNIDTFFQTSLESDNKNNMYFIHESVIGNMFCFPASGTTKFMFNSYINN